MTSRLMAASSTVVVNGPIWSRLDAKATSPYRDTRPYVGFSPTTPQNAAGWRIEPPVSVPSEPAANPAATAAAGPPDEPPGTRERSHGLRVTFRAECSVDEPIANSSMFDLPSRTAPAFASRSATVASYGGTKCSRIFEAHVVRMPLVQNTSLSVIGAPSSGPSARPWR